MISKGDTKDLHKHINVYANGERVVLPDVEGVVFLNIQSWGAGADAWGTSQDTVSSFSYVVKSLLGFEITMSYVMLLFLCRTSSQLPMTMDCWNWLESVVSFKWY